MGKPKKDTGPAWNADLVDEIEKVADQCGRALHILTTRPLSSGAKTYGPIRLIHARKVVYDYLRKRFPGATTLELAMGVGMKGSSKDLAEGPRDRALADMLNTAIARGDVR